MSINLPIIFWILSLNGENVDQCPKKKESGVNMFCSQSNYIQLTIIKGAKKPENINIKMLESEDFDFFFLTGASLSFTLSKLLWTDFRSTVLLLATPLIIAGTR